MRWVARIFALAIAVSVSGCAIIEAEKNNRGGYLDEIADEHWMKANSKRMRALRAITLEASLARISMIAPKSAADRSLLARRIGETTKRADMVRRCAFGELQLAGQQPGETCFFFDSVMVDYENALFDLALVALPIEDAKSLISRVTGGIAQVSVNPLQLVQALLDIGREAFRYGRVVGAIYRDTLELEVQVWLASEDVLADEAITTLRRIYARGNDDIPAWRAAIGALRARGLEPIPQQRFIVQLYGIIGYICGQIVSQTDPAFTDCAQPDLTQKIPVVNLSGRGGGGTLVLSGIGAGPRAGAARGSQSAKDIAGPSKGGGSSFAKPTDNNAKFALLLDPYKPQEHSSSYVESIQEALCLPRGSKEFGQPGAVTTALVEIYEITARARNANGKVDENEAAEMKGLGECEPPFQNYFERQTYPNDPRGVRAVAQLVDSLQQTKVGAKAIAGSGLALLRTTISEARNDPDIRAKVKRLPNSLLTSVTPDLLRALPRPRAASTSTSPATTPTTTNPAPSTTTTSPVPNSAAPGTGGSGGASGR